MKPTVGYFGNAPYSEAVLEVSTTFINGFDSKLKYGHIKIPWEYKKILKNSSPGNIMALALIEIRPDGKEKILSPEEKEVLSPIEENVYRYIACVAPLDYDFLQRNQQVYLTLRLGRFIHIPKSFASAVGIEDTAVIAGAADRIEVWKPEEFDRINENLDMILEQCSD